MESSGSSSKEVVPLEKAYSDTNSNTKMEAITEYKRLSMQQFDRTQSRISATKSIFTVLGTLLFLVLR